MKSYIFFFFLQISLILLLSVSTQAQLPQQQWVAHYDGTANGDDGASALSTDDLGNVYVTGFSYGNFTGYDYATVKYNSNGKQLWVARYDGPANGHDWVFDLAIDNLGNVYVTGYTESGPTSEDYATIKYDPNGNQLWIACYNGPGNDEDEAFAVAVDNFSNVYVSGYSYGMWTGRDYTTIKYDPVGKQLWVARYDGPVSGDDEALALAVDDFGNVYVTGYSSASRYRLWNQRDYATIKYDPDGKELWVAHYDGPASDDDEAFALAIDDFGNVYVTGHSRGELTGPDYATIKYDHNGNQLWVARYDGPASDDDRAFGIAVDNSGSVYVSGYIRNSTTYEDYATIKYDADGNQLWMARYNGPGNYEDKAFNLEIDDFGNAYVSGYSHGDDYRRDYTTIKYDPNGNQQWVARYDGPASDDDEALALAIDDSGNVYVAGYSCGSNAGWDYATVKYVQCVNPIAGDLNNDCKVDFADFAVLSSHWLECNWSLEDACW